MTDRGDLDRRRARLSPEQRALLERRLRGATASVAIPRRPEGAVAPLSFAQQRLWLLEQLEPGAPTFNLPHAIRLRGPLDTAALERALAALIARHEALRTTIAAPDGHPVQRIAPALDVPVQRLELAAGAPVAGDGALPPELGRQLAALAARPFDLERGPLIRILLATLGPGDHVLATVMHHIVTDGWSMGVLFRDLLALYRAEQARSAAPAAPGAPGPAALPPLAVQYADFAVWQRQELAGPMRDAELAYWRERLAGAPGVLELPRDRPRAARRPRRAGSRSRALGAATRASLGALAAASGTTPFVVLVAAVAELLHRLTGAEDLVLGTPTAGRTTPAIEEVVGFFVNTLALRIDLAGDPAFRELVHRVRGVVSEALSHQQLPFEQLVEALRPERRLDATPLFQVLIALQRLPAPAPPGELAVEDVPVSPPAVQLDLTFAFGEEGADLVARVDYDAGLFDAATIDAALDQLAALLTAALAAPERPLSRISALSASAAAALAAAQPGATPVPEAPPWWAVAEHARHRPAQIAVRCGGRSITYGELVAAAAHLAGQLRAAGIGPEQLVAVLVERGPELPVALLATLQAGGAFAPIDPALPPGRIEALLAELRPRAILTHERLRAQIAAPAGAQLLTLEALAAAPAVAMPPEAAARPPAPEQLAYVICTSGSTGRPKAVLLTHGGLANQLAWKNGAIRLGPADRFLHGIPVSFDPAVWGLLGPLAAGATLELTADADHRDPRAFAELARAAAATVLDVAAATLGALVREPDIAALGRHVRHVFCGGGVLAPALAQRFCELFPGATLFNQYGPTETTIDATAMPCSPREEERVPIGYPIANTQVHVLDAALAPVPPGAIGEIFIAGAGVGRGYLGAPALTAERFLPDPFARRPGARMYRTGDRGRRRADGAIDFLGRVDAQLKLRGQRIEPGEIEAVLAEQPGVAEAVVALRADPAGGEPRLAAYVAAAGPARPTPAELHAALRARLPEVMVPSYFVLLERLPRLPGGKLDARALPEPDLQALPRSTAHVEPRSRAERQLAELWCRLLGIDRVGIDDDFFELGGHSLLAARMVREAAAALGAPLELRRLFEQPTIRGLAASLPDAAPGEPALLELAPFEIVPGRRVAPLAYGQERLVREQLRDPDSARLNVPLGLRLTGPLDVEQLRGALEALVARHAVLRVVIGAGPAGLVQELAPAASAPVAVLDARGGPGDPRARVDERRLAQATRPFRLDQEAPLRLDLIRCGDAEHVLLATTHRHAYDGASLGILWRDLARLYTGRLRDPSFALAPLPASFLDVAAWQRAAFEGPAPQAGAQAIREARSAALEALIERWRPRWPTGPRPLQLQLVDGPALLAGAPREPAAIVERVLEPAAAAAIGRCHAALRISRAALIFAALAAGFDPARPGGLTLAVTFENRTLPGAADLVGRFVNLLPIHIAATRATPFAELARAARDRIAEALHDAVPFERLARALDGDPERPPADRFPVLVNVIEAPELPAELAGLRLAPLPPLPLEADFALSCNVLLGTGITLQAVYAPSRIERTAVEAFLDATAARLLHAARDPGRSLDALLAAPRSPA